jgi:segregation and condensation protein B
MLSNIVTILFLSGDPVSFSYVAELCGVTPEEVAAQIPMINEHLAPLGLTLLVNKKEFSIVTLPTQADLVQKFWKEELRGELTPATLQVLTLIAYLPGCTRQDISFIRGVQSTQSIRTLSVRGLVEQQGEKCTLSSDALRHLGVTHVEQLPDYATIRKELLEKLDIARQEQ